MAYNPVGNSHNHPDQPAQLANIDLGTRYDPGAYDSDAPPLGHPLGHPSNNTNQTQDVKSLLHSTSESVQDSEKWPVQSQQVASITILRGSLMVFDTILASMPIMFVALALVAARLDGEEVSDYGNKLGQTLLLSPTIFPLLFAALMGRFFRHLGLYLAERGTTLGRLEQLVGCQSVFSALERQICLRYWSIAGVSCVFVWLLSPLGGQSALRLLSQEANNVSSTITLRYLNPAMRMDSHMSGANDVAGGRSTYTSIFLAALLSSTRYQDTPMDLWGNVKLPLYRDIENSTADAWKPVQQHQGRNATYGSLIGVPVVGLPRQGYSRFNIKTHQFDITCSGNQLKEGAWNDSRWANITSTWSLKLDKARIGNVSVPKWPMPIVSTSYIDTTVGSDRKYSIASCDLNYNYLEAKLGCNGTSCGVDSVRKLDLFTDGYDIDVDQYFRNNMIGNLMFTFPSLDNDKKPAARGSTNAEKWIANPSNFIGIKYENEELYKIKPDIFAQRLTVLWNTFFQSTFATNALGGALPNNITQTGLLVGSNNRNVTFNATQADFLRPTPPVYKTNWKWFTALLVSSVVLLAAGYAGLILKYITLAPDIIGYASSLTLLNPYVPTPTGGTTLHGLERSALLHDLPVRIGDVCANEPVGAIAFAKADDGRVNRLDRRRWYI